MNDERPDPDQLLASVQAAAQRATRGRLKIFFGASAGVGKTWAMLNAARTQAREGRDVVVGIVETHGRRDTEAMVTGLEQLPLRQMAYRDRTLGEFDLDAALTRHPALILVDELAHSNVTGSRHAKRWQDIDELLAAGIDVCTTVNVQHLESLNDVVTGITGIRVFETVPDRIFDAADEVVLVDLPPDELLQRLREGKVYLPHQAERAIRNFFRKGNLIALRELALRRTADRVDDQMLQYRREQFVAPVWQTRDSLLACVGPGAGAERIVRTAARFANQLAVPWHALYVETPDLQRLSEARRHGILRNLRLAQELGAESASLAGADAITTTLRYARNHNLGKVLVGRDQRRGWRPWDRSFADRLGQVGPDLDVIQVARGVADAAPRPTGPVAQAGATSDWPKYLWAALACGVTGALATPLYPVFDLANIVMLFLLTVLLVAVRLGRGPAVLAAFLSVLIFDFFFVPPRFSFAVSDVQYLLTFAVLLAVGLITGQLMAGYKFQAEVATRREERARALYEMARSLSAALLPEQIAEIGARFIASEWGGRAAFLLADAHDKLGAAVASTTAPATLDPGIAQWAFDHAEAAGLGTDTLAASAILYLPLKAPMRVRGVLAIEPDQAGRLLAPEARRLLDTFGSLIAIAFERVHYVEVAQTSTVQMESERLRNSLLAAISHDLRTPLSVLIGLADTLLLTRPQPTIEQASLAGALREEALRISAQVNNLLDMARLQAGPVELNRQWQPLEEVIGSALKAIGGALNGHVVKVRLDDDLPLVQIDSVLMERVLANLLENAGKYTPPGTLIEILGHTAGRNVEICVQDEGPGLPPGKESTVFKKFERGQSEGTTPGVGLGLAICRTIVLAHGGAIRAENRPRGGARFIVELPCGQPPALLGEDPTGAPE